MDRDIGLQVDLIGILPGQPGADAWNGPAQVSASVMMPALAPRTFEQMLSTRRPIRRPPAGDGHQQDAARIDAVDDEMSYAVGERVGLPRPSAGNDQQRPGLRIFAHAKLHCPALLRIEFGEMGQVRRHVRTSKNADA